MRRSPFLLVLLTMAVAALAQQPAPAPAKPAEEVPTIRTTVDEVLLDVVVRDKKGKPVKDLKPEDLEIVDNGAPQQIKSFRIIEGREAIEKGARTQLDPLRQVRLVTLVFERLGEDPRRLARQAAMDLIKGEIGQNVFYAVVVIDQQLFVLQEFTRDRDKLKKAVETATSGQISLYAGLSSQVKAQLRQAAIASGAQGALVTSQSDASARPSSAIPLQPGQAAPALAGSGPAAGGQDFVTAKLAQVMLDMSRMEASFSAQEGTRTSIMALLSLVRGQYQMPGRKTILYFSQGMWVPQNLDEAFRAILSTANRGNVTFYAVDTRGVMTWAQNQSTANQLSEALRESAETSQGEQGRAVTFGQAKAADTAENAMRNNVQLYLRELSDSTGGFLIGDTNDFRKPVQQVAEEVNAYYEIAYNPGIENYDGRFRKTEVRLKNANYVVHSRNGYFALPPDVRASGMLPYEVPLLKALSASPLPKEMEFRSSAVRFQPSPQGARASVLVEVPLGNLTYTEDPTAKTFKGRLSMVALLKNDKGEVLQKFSRDLPLAIPADKIEPMKQSNFIYREEFEVGPGRYFLETAVIDQETKKVAAKRASFNIAAKQKGVSLSNITLVRTYQPKAQGLDPADPFQFQGGRITPTLNSTVKAVKGALLAMFFVVYPDAAIAEKPHVTIEYIKDGQVIGKGDIDLPPADAQGRIPYVMSSPAENLPPGSYEIRAVVKQGDTVAEDRAFVTVEAQ
ncbi:MAG: VWA domain-containing protein [Bryobacteraceae bacterium]|nr:VWA domain-containing protein [Bryobacteraceae bacterium]